MFLGGSHVIVIIDARSRLRVRSLALAASGRTQRIELSGKLCLRLDERTTIIAHWLVAGVGVLGEESKPRRDQEHDKEDQGESGVVHKENHTHDTSNDGLYMLV